MRFRSKTSRVPRRFVLLIRTRNFHWYACSTSPESRSSIAVFSKRTIVFYRGDLVDLQRKLYVVSCENSGQRRQPTRENLCSRRVHSIRRLAGERNWVTTIDNEGQIAEYFCCTPNLRPTLHSQGRPFPHFLLRTSSSILRLVYWDVSNLAIVAVTFVWGHRVRLSKMLWRNDGQDSPRALNWQWQIDWLLHEATAFPSDHLGNLELDTIDSEIKACEWY